MSDWTPGPAWLFCPADRLDRYPKALAAADVVILDLEDAVAPADKQAARDALRHLDLDRERTVLRINGAQSPEHAVDLGLAHALRIPRVMLAKSEDPHSVAALHHEVVVLAETALGVERVGELAQLDNVIAVMWGADDLVAGMGGTSSRHPDGSFRDVARYARSRSLIAAKAAGRMALDAVHQDIDDLDGLAAECEDAVAVGFDATVAIHPKQVPVIRSSFRPTDERIDWARRLLEHVGTDPKARKAVTVFEGQMVDGPNFKQAERVLRLAELTEPS